MRLRLLHEAIDLLLGQPAGCGDANGLFLAGSQVLCGHMHDAVCIDIKGHLDLGNTPGCRRYAYQIEPPDGLVVLGHLPLTLQHVDGHGRLVVRGGGEYLAFLRRDGGVLLDELGEHASQGLDPEGERRHVQKQHILDVSHEDAALNRRTHRHHLVGIDPLVRIPAEYLLDLFLHLGHTGHAAHQDHLVYIGGAQSRILQGGAAGLIELLNELIDQGLQLGPGELDIQMLRPPRRPR